MIQPPTFLASRSGRFRQTTAAEALDQHLQRSIADLKPPTESEPKMRGMQRLAHLTQTIVADLDKEADAVADHLVAGQDRAKAAIDKFRDYAGSIHQTADEIERALGQITNSPPLPEGS
jgi:hypothetical protein